VLILIWERIEAGIYNTIRGLSVPGTQEKGQIEQEEEGIVSVDNKEKKNEK